MLADGAHWMVPFSKHLRSETTCVKAESWSDQVQARCKVAFRLASSGMKAGHRQAAGDSGLEILGETSVL